MQQLSGAQALVKCLKAESVSWVYGIVGGKLAPLMHAISLEPSLRFVGVRHEGVAPMMAAIHYASGDSVAVALGEMGPGSLNLASGMGGALANHLPLLAITTNQHRAASYPHKGMFMDLDTKAVFAPLTRWNAVVHDARRIPELVRTAFREALGSKPGPVHLDIPQDVLNQVVGFADAEFALQPHQYRFTGRTAPAFTEVTAALELLRTAKRPLIVAGGGVVASAAIGEIQTLAKLLNAPVIATQMALGVVPTSSPHFIGHGGLIAGEAVKTAFEKADVVLSVGCRHSSWMWDEQGPFVRSHHRTISINTNASALGQPVMHEVAMQSDAKQALQMLLTHWPTANESATEQSWLTSLKDVRKRYEEGLNDLAQQRTSPMHPATLAKAVASLMPANALAVFDGGHTTFWSNDFTAVHATRTHFHEPGMSHLGFGLPFAMTLKLLNPDRPVFNITGDGSFGFTLNELDTARRNRLAVITIIHNNAAWGIIRAGQKKQFDFELGTSLADSDYAAIARGFGCYGETVSAVEEFEPALNRAMQSGLPAVLDCHTQFLPHPAGAMFGSMNRYGN